MEDKYETAVFGVSDMSNREVPDEDGDMLVVKGEDEDDEKENDDDILEYMYGGAFSLSFAKLEGKSAAATLKESSKAFTPAGKSHLV